MLSAATSMALHSTIVRHNQPHQGESTQSSVPSQSSKFKLSGSCKCTALRMELLQGVQKSQARASVGQKSFRQIVLSGFCCYTFVLKIVLSRLYIRLCSQDCTVNIVSSQRAVAVSSPLLLGNSIHLQTHCVSTQLIDWYTNHNPEHH